MQTDDILGGLAVRGYGATTFTGGRGQVMFKAAENWTDTANGTYLQFTTTPLGSWGWSERMRIDPSGRVGIGTTTPAQRLSVAGTVESTTGGFKFPDGSVQTTAAGAVGDPGLKNTASGRYALLFNTTGEKNTASGYEALFSNTTGYWNTADGTDALHSNTEGFDNTASGAEALYRNTTGAYNTASGSSALYSNTTGLRNTASGWKALYSNTTGNYNTASGSTALVWNTTGEGNTASGSLTPSMATDTMRWLGGQMTATVGRAAEASGGSLAFCTCTTTVSVAVPP